MSTFNEAIASIESWLKDNPRGKKSTRDILTEALVVLKVLRNRAK